MMRNPAVHVAVSLCVVAVCGALSVSDAAAQQPQTSTYVNEVMPSMEPSFQTDGATAYAGIDQCQTLIESNPRVDATYITNVQITDPDLYGGVYHFRFDRGDERSIACRSPDGDLHEECQGQLDEEDVTIEANEVDAEIRFQELTGLSSTDVCDDEEYDASHYVQLRLRDYTATGVDFGEWQYADARFVFDLVRPDAPSITDAMATENSIQVEFERSEAEDLRNHAVVYSTESFEGGELAEEVSDRSPRRIEGEEAESGRISASLEGGDTVYVAVVSRDHAGNYSVVSSPIEATVIETRGFWDFYVEGGGQESGGYGCSSTGSVPALPVMFVVAAGLLLAARRPEVPAKFSPVVFTAVVAAASLLLSGGAATEAHAYDDDQPTSGMMEFKLGPYFPQVDAEFDNGPYAQFFDNRSMLAAEFAVDYHLWRRFGTLSVGAHFGYSRVSAPMIDQEGEVVDSQEQASFRIIPLKASLVYRYDYSAHEHGIPLVPVGKIGVNYNFWRVTDPGGDTMQADGQRAVGGRAGWHATLGLHLHLNFFDPTSAAALDLNWGIPNSFLFAEYTWTRVDGFGTPGIDLSANHWAAGLAFEF